MQITIGSKQYTFIGEATPANIAQQIAAQESGTNPEKLSQKLSEAVFGAAYRKNDVIDARRFEDGILNLESRPFERLLGLVESGASKSAVMLAPPPPVVIQAKTKTNLVPPPAVPSDILGATLLAETKTPESKTSEAKAQGPINKAALEAHPVFQHSIAPLLTTLKFTTFELTTPARDDKLETGAYFNPKSNCVVLNQKEPVETILDNLIFELCNAKFKSEFESIASAFDEGRISISDYGNAYAATEFKTQMAYTAIVRNLQEQGFQLPEGAERAITWANDIDPSYVHTGDTSQLLTSFMSLPHSNQAAPRDVASLPSPDMYAFQALEKMGGQKLFNLIEAKVGKGVLPAAFSGWARHSFPMKSASYKRAKAYQEVLVQATNLLQTNAKAVQQLRSLALSTALSDYAALRAGPRVMPNYPA